MQTPEQSPETMTLIAGAMTRREEQLLRIIGFLRIGYEASVIYSNQLADALKVDRLPPVPRRSHVEQVGVDLVQDGAE